MGSGSDFQQEVGVEWSFAEVASVKRGRRRAKTVIKRQIEATDGQTDRLVYDLTDEEIAIVEAGTGRQQ